MPPIPPPWRRPATNIAAHRYHRAGLGEFLHGQQWHDGHHPRPQRGGLELAQHPPEIRGTPAARTRASRIMSRPLSPGRSTRSSCRSCGINSRQVTARAVAGFEPVGAGEGAIVLDPAEPRPRNQRQQYPAGRQRHRRRQLAGGWARPVREDHGHAGRRYAISTVGTRPQYHNRSSPRTSSRSAGSTSSTTSGPTTRRSPPRTTRATPIGRSSPGNRSHPIRWGAWRRRRRATASRTSSPTRPGSIKASPQRHHDRQWRDRDVETRNLQGNLNLPAGPSRWSPDLRRRQGRDRRRRLLRDQRRDRHRQRGDDL